MMVPKLASPCRFDRRQGSVLPLLAVTLVALISFVALAIDVGMLAIAKAQAQNSADLAALTAARTLTGSAGSNYNQSQATTNAQNILTYNKILGQSIQSSQLQLSYGSYDYNQTTQTFNANFPATSGMPLTAVSSTVTSTNSESAFAAVLGYSLLPTVTAVATAVHRPRDIALTMDLSASMRFGTCLGFDFYTSSRTSNNPDSVYPTFGHYSSGSAGMQGPSSNQSSMSQNYTISPSNTTATNSSYTLTYVNSFYQNAAYAGTLIRAFDSYTSTDGGSTWTAPSGAATPQLPPSTYTTTPGGDVPLYKQGTSTYATDVNDVVNVTTRNKWWELDGYSGCTSGSFNNADLGTSTYASGSFNAYTQGPGYYGKTFFIWPPDPRQPLTTANNSTQINQFLLDFGYGTNTDFANAAFTTTLAVKISLKTQTSISVSSSTPFPISGLPGTAFSIIIGSEIMQVTAASGAGNKTWTVKRAQNGTTASTYAAGATVALVTGPPLYGIYGVTTTSGSQNWPWPNDSGATLSSYLTKNVYIPASAGSTARLLQTTDAVYQKIIRLYNWNYVVDNYNSAGSGSNYPGTTPCDWRVRFFGTNNNTLLFASSGASLGTLNVPSGSTYTINYNEILRWLTTTSNPFSQQLRAGRIKYYGSIPTQITGSWPTYGSTDQRFWKEFIDYALGFKQTGASTYQDISAMAGYGSDFSWGSKSISSPPSATQYMSYTDNPLRPKLRYWFGPMNMVDYMQNCNMGESQISGYFWMQPGDGYEAPLYSGKQAFLAAIQTMQSNNPNDWFTAICYSWPRSASNGIASSGWNGRFNCVRSPLGPNYNYAQSALVFPFSTINADGSCNNTELTPYTPDPATSSIPSADFVDTPRGDGDTCFDMALMLAYNQFATTSPTDSTLRSFVSSNPITFPSGMAGGLGRKGAQKVVVFETDGIPNCTATASLVNAGTYKYYAIRYDMNNPSGSQYPSVTPYGDLNDTAVLSNIQTYVTQLKTDYSSSRNPFALYAIGFGPVFQGVNSNAAQSTLQSMQFWAGTQSSASTPLPASQIVIGTDAQMTADMVNAFTTILQNGVQIALIQ